MRSGREVTALIEHDIPGGGRAYTAVTVAPNGPLQIEFRRPGAPAEVHRFASIGDYAAEWGSRARYADPDSSGYRDLISDLDAFYDDPQSVVPQGQSMAGSGPRRIGP